MNGTLALVGSGEYLEPMEPVDRLLLSRLSGEARVACLPTAAGTEGPKMIAHWSQLGVDHFNKLGAMVEAVEVIDRATANDDSLAAKIRAANFVYLSGGNPGYLYKTLKDSAAWAAITGVLENGGVVAGCSAGAMIFGENIPSFPTIWPLQPAFNFVPGVIMPHYDEFGDGLKQAVRTLAGKKTLLGIEGNTALVKQGGKFEVAGSGGVTVWNGKLKRRFTNGERVEWK
ncbi:MAG: Type 1 glutamine amidotransferase-like domain-containing protein [Chloroflexi bacterium]|nr:Type 1 glutamine amidotransferase-like domain-containing protein [Chloroflexota bacterium]